MNTRELTLVNGCPSWCSEDHTAQAEGDRGYHSGPAQELRLPDGRLVLEAFLTLDSDAPAPEVAVCGPGVSLLDDVQLLGLADATEFEKTVQRFAAGISRMTAAVRVAEAQRPGPRRQCRAGKMKRAAWRETRLYLAERDGRHCFYCRTEFDKLRDVTIDHYVPKSVWPCNLPANLVLACDACNRAKADRLTWSMTAVLLAWQAREGGAAADGDGAQEDMQGPPATASLASLAG